MPIEVSVPNDSDVAQLYNMLIILLYDLYTISSTQTTQPLELVGMDLVGKLTTTKSGNQYICVMIDYFTKWTEAYPLKSKCAAEVCEYILDFLYRFGAPQRILTDQGKEFVNKITAFSVACVV